MASDAEAIEAVDWIAYLCHPRKKTLLDAEQDGFVHLLRGYKLAPDLVRTLGKV